MYDMLPLNKFERNEEFQRMRKIFPEYSRQDIHDLDAPMYLRLRRVAHDPLAQRQLTLRTHGYPTLVNSIFRAHGRPNQY